MGSPIEINDTLQLTAEQGFPCEFLNREKHCRNPLKIEELRGKLFSFLKEDARLYHLDPVRVFLVENINGKWLFWGHALMQSQEIRKRNSGDKWKSGEWETAGTFVIDQIYEPEFQKQVTINQSPRGKSYF